jgi:hypothetical protein
MYKNSKNKLKVGPCLKVVEYRWGKIPLGKPARRWEDHIKIDFKEWGCEGINYIHLVQDMNQRPALVNTVMDLPGA